MNLSEGTVLTNRYKTDGVLGGGNFGRVYRAWDLNLKCSCAVKENLQLSEENKIQFLQEAQILRNLSHKNLPKVYDHFETSQGQYFVMDYIEGQNLSEMLCQTGNPLTETYPLKVITQVCDALSYLHLQKPPVIHRDVKPENIRITSDEEVFLVDFGIFKLDASNQHTPKAARAATPGYAPKEQYGVGNTDARTDVYALGATLYTLLTNEVPLESTQRGGDKDISRPSELNPTISPIVEQAILKAMEIEPKDRYQSIKDFEAALIAPTIKIKPPQSTWKWIIIASTFFLVIAVLIVGLWLRNYWTEHLATLTAQAALLQTRDADTTTTASHLAATQTAAAEAMRAKATLETTGTELPTIGATVFPTDTSPLPVPSDTPTELAKVTYEVLGYSAGGREGRCYRWFFRWHAD